MRRMDHEMCALIDSALKVCEKYRLKVELRPYENRYKRLVESLKDIKEAVKEQVLYNKTSDLGVVNLIIQNDPQELINVILKVNNFYRKHYSRE